MGQSNRLDRSACQGIFVENHNIELERDLANLYLSM